ncbi:MAG: aminotransferase class I/II-fold pyridoxal phosphate-dependent enzyme [Thermoleophilia bacterium]
MHIEPFAVEQWMNAHETTARWNIAETCVHPLRVDELLRLGGEADETLKRLLATRLTYGHITGSPELRGAIAALYGAAVSAADVLVAGGAIAANFLVHFALVAPGDGVVCVTPTYQQLHSVPEALGAQVRLLPLRPEDGYLVDVDELRSLVDERTRLIVINNPNNPTGSLMGEGRLREIVAVARSCGAYLHCDEVYRYLEHETGATAPSVVDLYDRGISTGSMSKTFSLAGLRTGWVVAPPEVLERCLEVRDYTTISCGVLDDALAAMALTAREALLARSLAIVRENVELLDAWVRAEPRLHCVRPRAGTTALVRYDQALPSEQLCQGLFDFNGAFVVPGACFGQEGTFRVGYACAREVLVGGLAAVSEYLHTLEG